MVESQAADATSEEVGVPDWTYVPLRRPAERVLGASRAHQWALGSLSGLARLPAGASTIRAFLHDRAPAGITERLGAVVPPESLSAAARALPPLGAGVVLLSSQVLPTDVVLDDPDPTVAARLLSEPGVRVLASTRLLVRAGPGWFQRVAEATLADQPVEPAPTLRAVPQVRFWRWPGWFWGLLLGVGMVVAGLAAAAITLGPVLLSYDREYLRADRAGLNALNPNLIHFLQHDRLTLAGTMVSIGVLYAALAWNGLRMGRRWARTALLASGCVGFPTLLYYLGTGFFDPLHAFAAAVLFPMFVLAVALPPESRHWQPSAPGPVNERERALLGQLIMIAVGVGLLVGGIVISTVGLNGVYVPTDLTFLHTHVRDIRTANPRLPGFIAHDRAGFGGALASAAVAIVLLCAWGWRRGETWVWWTLAAAAVSGFGPTIAIHLAIGYDDLEHIGPVIVAGILTATALALSRPYLGHK